jgi:hypothetical protein
VLKPDDRYVDELLDFCLLGGAEQCPRSVDIDVRRRADEVTGRKASAPGRRRVGRGVNDGLNAFDRVAQSFACRQIALDPLDARVRARLAASIRTVWLWRFRPDTIARPR